MFGSKGTKGTQALPNVRPALEGLWLRPLDYFSHVGTEGLVDRYTSFRGAEVFVSPRVHTGFPQLVDAVVRVGNASESTSAASPKELADNVQGALRRLYRAA